MISSGVYFLKQIILTILTILWHRQKHTPTNHVYIYFLGQNVNKLKYRHKNITKLESRHTVSQPSLNFENHYAFKNIIWSFYAF